MNKFLNEETLLREISKVLVGANDWYGRPGKVRKNQTGTTGPTIYEEISYMGNVNNDYSISFPSSNQE